MRISYLHNQCIRDTTDTGDVTLDIVPLVPLCGLLQELAEEADATLDFSKMNRQLDDTNLSTQAVPPVRDYYCLPPLLTSTPCHPFIYLFSIPFHMLSSLSLSVYSYASLLFLSLPIYISPTHPPPLSLSLCLPLSPASLFYISSLLTCLCPPFDFSV